MPTLPNLPRAQVQTPHLNKSFVYYWPSAQAGGKGVGHLSVRLANSEYCSHRPDLSKGERVGIRKSIPGSNATNIEIKQHASLRHLTLEADIAKFGNAFQTLELPPQFFYDAMAAAGKKFLLAGKPSEVFHGPLPYYQMADREEGANDRSQCATTTAMIVSAGLSLEHQDAIKEILSKFTPDSLWSTLLDLAKQWAEKKA